MTTPKDPSTTAKKGRPTDYQAAYCEGAAFVAKLGATDAEVADFFKVNVATIYRWKNTHQDFCEALKVGKAECDDRVVRSLYHRAVGYEQQAVKIFMPAGADAPVYAPYTERIAPDTTAAIFWLKNRNPAEWRDRQNIEHTGKDGGAIKLQTIDPTKLSADTLRELLAARNATPEPDAS